MVQNLQKCRYNVPEYFFSVMVCFLLFLRWEITEINLHFAYFRDSNVSTTKILLLRYEFVKMMFFQYFPMLYRVLAVEEGNLVNVF